MRAAGAYRYEALVAGHATSVSLGVVESSLPLAKGDEVFLRGNRAVILAVDGDRVYLKRLGCLISLRSVTDDSEAL